MMMMMISILFYLKRAPTAQAGQKGLLFNIRLFYSATGEVPNLISCSSERVLSPLLLGIPLEGEDGTEKVFASLLDLCGLLSIPLEGEGGVGIEWDGESLPPPPSPLGLPLGSGILSVRADEAVDLFTVQSKGLYLMTQSSFSIARSRSAFFSAVRNGRTQYTTAPSSVPKSSLYHSKSAGSKISRLAICPVRLSDKVAMQLSTNSVFSTMEA
mmetsp:Transcript_37914/g.63769  ORF Transcript_37914/g.63769 Transcript_37914/m.63769 type:complete len:213 (-) Transcript_37914:2017-2655(-)